MLRERLSYTYRIVCLLRILPAFYKQQISILSFTAIGNEKVCPIDDRVTNIRTEKSISIQCSKAGSCLSHTCHNEVSNMTMFKI